MAIGCVWGGGERPLYKVATTRGLAGRPSFRGGGIGRQHGSSIGCMNSLLLCGSGSCNGPDLKEEMLHHWDRPRPATLLELRADRGRRGSEQGTARAVRGEPAGGLQYHPWGSGNGNRRNQGPAGLRVGGHGGFELDGTSVIKKEGG